ncbi:hypothetical protein H8K90_00430 [Winogradskyella echinorum]|uniref:Uncharacterized protein n=1 Tax=Winogradskyella echinorum TaxID=538189 RepID=A0ABR6XWH1_9FLAO|nr:hypothetical protein [Winogradskyella echinorum]MBC3844831.1 hypothetical protein [Winogradskyella echinorum]MBC5749179.1 hypothetical protein [Winogradskyella echinorum]
MRNLVLSLSTLMLFNFVHAQWTTDSSGALFTTQTLRIGEYNTGKNPYRMWYEPSADHFYFAMKNNTDKSVFSVSYNDASTYMALKNRLGSDLFKVGILGSDTSMFLHMPYSDSRLVIGSTGSYLLSEGHKLVIKNGSAKVEGNFFSTGSIGIGTMSFVDGADTYKLSVEGKVRAHGVKVYTDWADYVFEESYKLPTLEEVEKYIKENGHLKDIPSAEEVEESGIDLGEMNKLLLQKIEELTLYTIELKKEIEVLKSKID